MEIVTIGYSFLRLITLLWSNDSHNTQLALYFFSVAVGQPRLNSGNVVMKLDTDLPSSLHYNSNSNSVSSASIIVEIRLVNGHRPGRLVDLEIMADFKIVVDRLQIHDRCFKMAHIEAKSINIWLRQDPKWEILTNLSLHILTVHDDMRVFPFLVISQPNIEGFC